MKKFLKTAVPLFALLAIVVTCVRMPSMAATTMATIENGIYIGDVNVSGMSTLEAEAAVSEYVSTMSNAKITLDGMNNNKLTVTAGELGLSWSNPEVVDEAGGIGKSGNIIQRYKALKDLEHENMVLPLTLAVDDEKIRSILENDCASFNVDPVDATLSRENGAFVVTEGQTGVVIDVAGSEKAITELLTNGEWDGQDAEVELVAQVAEPRGTTQELSMVKDVLGTFTTSYSTSGSNRSGNVANGCKLINGTLLYPGDEFSTYGTVSPFTEANGYYMAGSYSNGMVVESLGGGICQVSTTLYNAVIRAELEVTQRMNHSMIVTYVDPSCDAAISGTEKDFRFVNNLEHPVYIEGVTTSDKKITFTVYGVETRPSNRKVTFESETISKTVPEGEKIIPDPASPVGHVDVQSAHIGYVAQLWKIVTVDGVEESREVFNKSTYAPSPRTATVGTATADPNVAAAINAAIASGSIDNCRAVAAGGAGAALPGPANAAAAAAQQAQIQEQQRQIAAAAAAAAQAQSGGGVTVITP